MTDEWTRIKARIDGYGPWATELEEKLTACPAISPDSGGTGEGKKAEVIEQSLEAIGVTQVERLDAADERAEGGIRPNLIARLPGREGGLGRLWIMSHLDVVPEGDPKAWTKDPWKVSVDGDRIYGRGVEDNQQGIVSSLILARALLEEGIAPLRDVCLLMVADEEVGSVYGIQHVLGQKDPFGPGDLIVVPDGGRPDGSQIEVAEKSILWMRLKVMGQTTHASTPERGVNAHRAAAHLLVELEGLSQIFSDQDDVFDPPGSTFEPTKVEANVPSINILPGEHVFYLDCRVLPQVPLADVEAEIIKACQRIEARFGIHYEAEAVQREEAAPPTPADAEVVGALKKAVSQVYGVSAQAEGIGGGTVAAYIRRAGHPAVVWSRMDETMHGPDEYVLISNLLGDAKVLAYLALH